LFVTQALLLRKVAFRESDAMLTLFTPDHGKLSVVARGASRSTRRFGGALEPMHTLRVELTPRRNEGFELQSCQLGQTRIALTRHLSRLEAAGTALGWIRKAAVEREPEPLVWLGIVALLDSLDSTDAVDCEHALATLGLRLLTAWGWGLELESCIRCGRACPEQRPAWVDSAQGGVICTSCGGARTCLQAEQRLRLAQASRGEEGALLPEDAPVALTLVEAAMAAHADIR
jgi:DNA repair protein RecO (recombination protein O)